MGIVIAVFAAMTVGICVGAIFGLGVGQSRTSEALKLRRYEDAIALARDVIMTPDALDLRDRAQRIVNRHDTVTNRKDS